MLITQITTWEGTPAAIEAVVVGSREAAPIHEGLGAKNPRLMRAVSGRRRPPRRVHDRFRLVRGPRQVLRRPRRGRVVDRHDAGGRHGLPRSQKLRHASDVQRDLITQTLRQC